MPLTGCIKDANDIARLLETDEDGSLNFHVNLQTDVPRRDVLKKMIHDLFAGDDEIALFYFSGHGDISKYGGYLVTPDYKNYDEGISINEMLVMANQSKARHKIIILDCCYSGIIAAPELNHAVAGAISQGVTILTSSSEDQPAVEVNGQGIFTGLLVEALKGGAADIAGQITPGSLYAYIEQALGPWQQTPLFKANVSEFVCLRKAAPVIALPVLRRIPAYFSSADTVYRLDPSYEYTNIAGSGYYTVAPYAAEAHVAIFQDLQEMCSVGLVEPVDEKHMYHAAMNSKSCRLTPLGAYYWRLAYERKI